jgi:hypothetical protein
MIRWSRVSHKPALWHLIVLTYGCDTCGAPPGQRCITSSGRTKLTEVHAARSYAARDQRWVAGDVPKESTRGGKS